MKKRLVLVGGGHAHLYTMARMDELVRSGCEVIVVSGSAHHYYSGMGPGMLSGIYSPADIRFNVRKMTEDRGGVFMEDSVESVAPAKRHLVLRSGQMLTYDVVSFNTGSEVSTDYLGEGGPDVFPVKPIINLLRARDRIAALLGERKIRIAIVGGGPAGVEVAGNVWRLVRNSGGEAEIHIIAGSRLLASHPAVVRRYALESLVRRGVFVREGVRVSGVSGALLALTDGTSLRSDIVLVAVGVNPSSLFRDSGLETGRQGGLLVNESLQSTSDPAIYGGGDCISFAPQELAKVGVYAVRQGPVLFQNVASALQGGSPVAFRPGGAYLLILNMGDGTGILWKKSFVWRGRLSFVLKDYIDRRFMRRYQLSGERGQEDYADFSRYGACGYAPVRATSERRTVMNIFNYFKPVTTWPAERVREYVRAHAPEEFVLLDVRQPKEYEEGHIPGAVFMPVGEIPSKVGELDPDKTTIAYCAAGVRSRAAAAVLKDAGFREVVSMEGGIRAWNGMVATGAPESGMAYFSSAERAEDLIALAWALEEGSRRFYQEMAGHVRDAETAGLLQNLSTAEEHHKESLAKLYRDIKGESAALSSPSDVMEGGIRVGGAIEWARRREIPEVLDFVMGLEMNAYDLYLKMGRAMRDESAKKVFAVLSDEEKVHLARLGELLEKKI